MSRLLEGVPVSGVQETGTPPFVMSFRWFYELDSRARASVLHLGDREGIFYIDISKVMAVFHPKLMSEDSPRVTLVRAPSKNKPKREPFRLDLSREWVRDHLGQGGLLSGYKHRRAFVTLAKGTIVHLREGKITNIEFKHPLLHSAMKKATDSR